jgi:hypothetical protein
MDDDLQQFEAQLKQLRPVPPSRTLVRRIEADLTAAPVGRRSLASLHWLWLASLPAAAAIAFVMLRPPPENPLKPGEAAGASRTVLAPANAGRSDETRRLKPIAAENVLVSASDEGLVILSDGTPARRERLQYVDTIMWKNPRTKASLTWSVPREEVRVVPVAFQ